MQDAIDFPRAFFEGERTILERGIPASTVDGPGTAARSRAARIRARTAPRWGSEASGPAGPRIHQLKPVADVHFMAHRGLKVAHRRMSQKCQTRTKCGTAKIPAYSISSSAMLSKPEEMVSPSALAVLMLMASSNLVGCRTGRSAGFLPIRIWPVRVPPCWYSSAELAP